MSRIARAEHRIALDEDDLAGTPRERLEPERATAREQVQATRAGQFELQPVEHGLADPVRSRPQTCRWWEMQLATAPFATDDSYFETAACGGSRAASRGTALRTVCCFGKTARAAEFPGDCCAASSGERRLREDY